MILPKALFLDRDGIINIDYGHVGTIDKLTFIPETIDLCKQAKKLQYKIIVITNQSGIAKGKFTLEDFLNLTEYIRLVYNKYFLDLIFYFCPYHKDSITSLYSINAQLQSEIVPSKDTVKINNNVFMSDYRKPNPGMILQASKDFSINILDSIFIGDTVTDMEAAKLAGIPNRVLVSNKDCHISTKNITKIPSSLLSLIKK